MQQKTKQITLGITIFVSSNFLLFLSVFFMLISDLLLVFLYHHYLLRYWGLKNHHNFQTSDDENIPITYSKSGGKYLLETIKNYVKQKLCYPVLFAWFSVAWVIVCY